VTINEKALELSPALVGQLRARAKQSLENFGASAETAELFKALVRIDPGDGLAWFNLGDSFRSACRFREAEEALLTARQLSSKSHDFVVRPTRHGAFRKRGRRSQGLRDATGRRR